jgi:sigma-B regulation protein RsbU (phosphoserine phosphatase)
MTDRFDWDSLRDLPASSWQDGSVTQRLLDHSARSSGVKCLAVYSPTEDGWGRVAHAGAELAPSHLSELPSGSHRLPGGLALLREGGEPLDDPALDALLTAGVQLQRLGRQVKRQSFQQGLHTVKLQALYDVGLAIGSTLNLDDLTEEILMHAVALLDARRGALFLIEGDVYRLQRAIGGDAVERLPVDARAVAAVMEGEHVPGDSFLPGVTHFMAVPIETDGRPQGILVIGDKESRKGVGPFDEEDQRSLSLFASQAAIALENARLHRQAIEKERLDREMELAAEIQRGLLPTNLPQSGSLESIGWNRPTQHVGGDYFGSFELAEGKTGFVVADVTGKGMPAALLVSTLHSALRLLLDRGESCEQLLCGLNQHIHEFSSSNKFITLILALIDNQRDEFEFVNAGHNPGLLVRSDGRVEELGAGGVPLGLLAGSSYVKANSTLCRGDLLCLYSDGITECEAPDDEQYGQERLEEFLKERRTAPLKQILSDLDTAVQDWAAGRSQGDDQTVILLRRI